MIAVVHFGVLFALGVVVLLGMFGAWSFQRIRIPQVVGYIVIGLILGESGFNLVSKEDILTLRPLNFFALGIIGALVGSELRIETFRKYAKQFFAILLGEGVTAFIFVTIMTGLVTYLVTSSVAGAVATGIVFGAIASATDPASTIDVLWEYRAKGVLTTSLIAIVALDDALAMTLYGLGTGAAQMLTSKSGSIVHELEKVSFDLFGALATGFCFAVVLRFILHWLHQRERALAIAVGLILLLIGICTSVGMDIILASMMMGFALINMAPRRSQELFDLLKGFSIPIYVMFFVMVGARLDVSKMPTWMWIMVILYVVARTSGKMFGAWFGARTTGSAPAVRKYLGLGLFAQGGVAVGLSIIASHHLAGIQVHKDFSLGDMVIFVVTATTLIVQIIGPPMVKLAIKLAGEIERNITDEDVIASWTVADVMERDVTAVKKNSRLIDTIRNLAEHDYETIPVIDEDNRLVGTISLEDIKGLLLDQESWKWILAYDVMEPPKDVITPSTPLTDVLNHMRAVRVNEIPVVDSTENNHVVGILRSADVRRKISHEVIKRQRAAIA